MKRRSFLQAGSLAAAPLLLKGIPVFGAPNTGNAMLDALAQASYSCGKILVIVQMNGGNDALNMVFAKDKWQHLTNARANILLNSTDVLDLNNNPTTGLHPAMPELKNMYNDGKLMIVQGVSYPNPSFSHFRATDIWFSGSGSSTNLDTGWLGRELDTQYPGFPAAFPNSDMLDPLAIQIGSTLPFSLQGPAINMGYNVTNPTALLNVINGVTDPAPNNDYGRELSFIRLMKDQSNAYRTVIQSAYNTPQPNGATYPTGNNLADQLKIVAKLINGGLQTPIYIVNHPNSHDTHENQVNTADKKTGLQPNMFKILSQAIGAFQQDLELMGKQDKVSGMTYSEFGRRITSNASVGTDHGTSAPVMFFGAGLNTNASTVAGTEFPVPGMIGTSPNIPLNATVNDQLPLQFDFRRLYSSVMTDWLCLPAAQTEAVLGGAFNRLPIFRPLTTLAATGIELTGQYIYNKASLSYVVNGNDEFENYSVEFSSNGIDFAGVGSVQNHSLNITEQYAFNYETGAKKMWFRVKAQKRQGGFAYSNILVLRSNAKEQLISIYPNPVINQQIHIKFYEPVNGPVDVTILGMNGAKHFYNRYTLNGSVLSFRVPVLPVKIHYVVEVQYNNMVSSEQIIFE